MTTRFEQALHTLGRALRDVGASRKGEYSIFGSTALILRGIIDREPGDIDVFVTRRVWGLLLPDRRWWVETPNVGDPPILVHDGRPGMNDIKLNLFFAWRDPQVEIDAEEVLENRSALVLSKWGSWRCTSVEEVLRHKEAALSYGSPAVQKHRPDIEACRIYLGGSSVMGL